jgi:hypothetical protein
MVAISADTARAMLDAADRAYAARVAEYVDDQVDLCRQFDPELFVALDIDTYRREVERRLRAAELDDWPEAGE